MYTLNEVMKVIEANPVGFSIAGIMVYVFGFLQYFTSIALQVREKNAHGGSGSMLGTSGMI